MIEESSAGRLWKSICLINYLPIPRTKSAFFKESRLLLVVGPEFLVFLRKSKLRVPSNRRASLVFPDQTGSLRSTVLRNRIGPISWLISVYFQFILSLSAFARSCVFLCFFPWLLICFFFLPSAGCPRHIHYSPRKWFVFSGCLMARQISTFDRRVVSSVDWIW